MTFYGEETTDQVQEAHSQAISDPSSGTINTHLSPVEQEAARKTR